MILKYSSINRLSIEIYYNEDIYDINHKDMILYTNKYKDELLRLNDYLEMNGYEFSTYNYPGVSNDEITNDFNKIFEIKPINSISLYYK
jgi:glycyl-tRNA synthetase alpha subunit